MPIYRVPAPNPCHPRDVLAAWGVPGQAAQAVEQDGVAYLEVGADFVSQADLDALTVLLASWVQPPSASERATTIDGLLAQSMAGLQTIIDTADIPAGTLTGAQLSNHVRALQQAVKVEARALRRLVRLVRGDLSGTD